jgi:hypothetical protein
MPIGLDLDPIEPRRLHALGGVDVILENALDVPVFQLFWKRAVRGFPIVRRRHDRQPIALVPSSPAPEMGKLDHHRRAVLMAGVGEAPEPRNDLVFVNEDIVEGGRAVGRHRRRARRHRHGDSGAGALDVVGAVEILWHPVFGIGRLVRRDDDPVAQREMLEPIGLEQRVG